jgi:hypothetical protein
MAHDSGELLDPAAEWEIPLATLRQAFSKHEGNTRLRDSLERLRSVKANISYFDEKGEPRVILTSLFDFFDIPAREMTTRPILRFGLPRKMIPFLECSGRWGRIKAEITCAMTSRYAIALYELVQLRSGLEKSLETVTIGRFRELLSVPPGNYDRVDNLMRKVIEPAVLQVNGLSDMGVMIQGNRKHSRAPVDSFNVAWWRKSPDDFRRAQQERNRSKVGRMARLKERSRPWRRMPRWHCLQSRPNVRHLVGPLQGSRRRSRVDRCYRSDTFPVSQNLLAAAPAAKGHVPASNRPGAAPLVQGSWRRLWRNRLGGRGGKGCQHAMARAHSRACTLSVIEGNSRHNSIAADNSPCCSNVARIAAASASVTTNMQGAW